MTATRAERRRLAIAERKAATKARLSVPVAPPTVPVALPWQRRRRPLPARRIDRDGEALWTLVGAHDAMDLSGSLLAASTMAARLEAMLKGRR
jgi:hypothetical protein